MNTDILLLRRSDVTKLLTLSDCIDAMREAFAMRSQGRALAPGLMHVDADGGEFHIKGGGLRMNPTYFGLKANGGFFGNRKNFGLPNIIGLILLFDGQNGRPLAVMDSIAITIMRTAATTALAAKYLARSDSAAVTICGCGNQGRAQLTALKLVLPRIERVFAWDTAGQAAVEFATEMTKRLGISVKAESDLGPAAKQSDVIVTCTPAKGFFLRREFVRPGTFVSAVGADSPDKQELEPTLLANCTLVVDILDQCAHVGELHHALDAKVMTTGDVHGELGDVVALKIAGRTSADEITVFDTTGSAIQDTAAAALVYKKAIAQGIGTTVNLYE
jgi:ornithine cyclodeaminase/alanine dehydrogenase